MRSARQNLIVFFTPTLKGEGNVALKAPFRGLGAASDNPGQKGHPVSAKSESTSTLKGESTLVLRRSQIRALNGNKTPALKGEVNTVPKAPFRGLGVVSVNPALKGDFTPALKGATSTLKSDVRFVILEKAPLRGLGVTSTKHLSLSDLRALSINPITK